MMTAAFLITFLVVSYFLFQKAIYAARDKAKFKLFAVRDELIYLVASGKLSEENPVFRHYYGRLNSILQAAPKVGIDDILRSVLSYNGSVAEFDKAIQSAENQLKKLLCDSAMKNPEVRSVVAKYYEAIRFLIFSHSSIAVTTYYLMRFASAGFMRWTDEHLPRKLANVSKTFRHADKEANELGHELCGT